MHRLPCRCSNCWKSSTAAATPPTTKPNDDGSRTYYLKIPSRAELQAVNQIFHREHVLSLHPKPPMASPTRISHRLNSPVGLQFTNHGHLSREPCLRADNPPVVPPAATCSCQQWKTSSSINDVGHVISTEPSCIKSELLRSVWLKGRKYRCQFSLESASVVGIDECISSCNDADADFSAWRDSILVSIRDRIRQFVPSAENRLAIETCPEALAALQAIHRDIVVTHTDKSSHNLVMPCRHLYRLWMELPSPVYGSSALSADNVAKHHASCLPR